MELTHTFTVPAPLATTWAAFDDIESVAECFPGATVTSVEGEEFKGSCKVKLGPIALVYTGTGRFLSKDADAGRFVVEAKGKDKRGNGTAGATVTASFSSPTPDTTQVSVVTDLAITGKPAQFGRGVMQDVSDKLLQAFVDCLQQKVGNPEDEQPASVGGEEPAGTPQESGDGAGAAGGDGAAGGAAAPAVGVVAEPVTARGEESAEQPFVSKAARENDALDLGATVLPVLLKSYWKQGVGALVVLLLLRRMLRR